MNRRFRMNCCVINRDKDEELEREKRMRKEVEQRFKVRKLYKVVVRMLALRKWPFKETDERFGSQLSLLTVGVNL